MEDQTQIKQLSLPIEEVELISQFPAEDRKEIIEVAKEAQDEIVPLANQITELQVKIQEITQSALDTIDALTDKKLKESLSQSEREIKANKIKPFSLD